MFEKNRAEKLATKKTAYVKHEYNWFSMATYLVIGATFVFVVSFFINGNFASWAGNGSFVRSDEQGEATGSLDSSQHFIVNNSDEELTAPWKSVIYDNVIAKKIADIIEFPLTFNDYLVNPGLKNHTVRNMIFYGPPGTGKSFSALALARDLSSHYKVIAAGALQYKYVGLGASKWSENIQEAKRIARDNIKLDVRKPVFIIVEEIDSLCQTSSPTKDRDDTMLNTFLASVDSIERESLNIIIIGTTNYINVVAESAKRPGRLNKIYFGEPNTAELWSKRIDCIKKDIQKIFRIFEDDNEAKQSQDQKGIIIREDFWKSLKDSWKENRAASFVLLKEQIITQIKAKIQQREKESSSHSYITLNTLDSHNIVSDILSAQKEPRKEPRTPTPFS